MSELLSMTIDVYMTLGIGSAFAHMMSQLTGKFTSSIYRGSIITSIVGAGTCIILNVAIAGAMQLYETLWSKSTNVEDLEAIVSTYKNMAFRSVCAVMLVVYLSHVDRAL